MAFGGVCCEEGFVEGPFFPGLSEAIDCLYCLFIELAFDGIGSHLIRGGVHMVLVP
jgi:hypothetical protein